MSLPRHPTYKDSGVEWLEEVPEHWRVVPVRRLVHQIEQGWSPECLARPAEAEEWGVLKSGCVNRGVFVEQENKALPTGLLPIPEYEIRRGDVLMCRASGSPTLVGSTAIIAVTRPRLMLSDKIFRLHPNPTISPNFLAYAFSAETMRGQIERAISGADGLANNLPQSALKQFAVAVPPTAEQHAIAAFLDREIAKIDALVAEQRRLIELLKEKRQAVTSHFVTKGSNSDGSTKPSGIEWLGDVPTHWRATRLRTLFRPAKRQDCPERRPSLYFDQFALYEVAKSEYVDRFFKRFETHGELFFSHINMMEVGFLREASAARVREFLRRVGPNWIPLEFQFDKVVIAENERKPGETHPALSEALLKFVHESGPLDAPITLDRIIDEFARDDLDAHRKIVDQMKGAMAQAVSGWQNLTSEEVERQFPIVSHAGPTLYLLSRLIRAIVGEAKAYRWTPNDAFDFSHALIPMVYADAVFLDKQWKGRIARLNLEGPFATVFYGNEIPQFLDWFESFPGTAEQ